MSGIEILGIAASVLQIADLGGKLSVKLFTFSRKIKNADKSIENISQDIAATGAILQQLGSELKKDEHLRLCSHEAVSTARGLVDECNRVFTELNHALESNSPSHKLVSGWKLRLKYPFLEPQIDLLRTTLDRLKSSLLVILNVMIFAEQLRNQEALPILKDQRELLKTLVDEKAATQRKFEQILKSLEDAAISPAGDHATTQERPPSYDISLLSQINTISISSHPGAAASATTGRDVDYKQGKFGDRTEVFTDHNALVDSLINEINATRYKINRGLRKQMRHAILDIHWEEWISLRNTYGADAMLEISPPAVHNFWLSKLEEEEEAASLAASDVQVSSEAILGPSPAVHLDSYGPASYGVASVTRTTPRRRLQPEETPEDQQVALSVTSFGTSTRSYNFSLPKSLPVEHTVSAPPSRRAAARPKIPGNGIPDLEPDFRPGAGPVVETGKDKRGKEETLQRNPPIPIMLRRLSEKQDEPREREQVAFEAPAQAPTPLLPPALSYAAAPPVSESESGGADALILRFINLTREDQELLDSI